MKIFFAPLLLLPFLPACTPIQRVADRRFVRALPGDEALVRAAATQVLTYTYPRSGNFGLDTLGSEPLKKALSAAGLPGSLVSVTYRYEGNVNYSGPIDSTVCFTQWGLTIREIIYDFAVRERTLGDSDSIPPGHAFQKIGHRTYFRRRPVPMM